MGADIVGWRDCSLQRTLGEEGFFRNLKLLAYKRAAERAVPAESRQSTPIRVHVGGEVETLSYAAIVAELAGFENGIPECSSCPLSGGRPLGCYRYVAFPVAPTDEETLCRHAERALARPASAFHDVASAYLSDSDLQSAGDAFRSSRGPQPPCLAARDEPVRLSVLIDDAELDGADVLAILLTPIQDADYLVALAAFWQQALSGADQPAERSWDQWRELGSLVIAASEMSQVTPGVAVLIDA